MKTLCSNSNTSTQPSVGGPGERATELRLKRARARWWKPWAASPMQAVARSCRCLAACLSQQQAMAYNLRVLQLCWQSCGGQATIAGLFSWTDSLIPSSSFLFFSSLFFSLLFHSFLVMTKDELWTSVQGLVLVPRSSAAADAARGDQHAAELLSAAARCSRQLSSMSRLWMAAAEVLLTSAWQQARMTSTKAAASPKAACTQPRCAW